MKQYVEMLEDLYDPETETKFIKGLKYAVTYETEDAYYLGKQGKNETAIGKDCEGKIFKVDAVKTPRPSK